MTRLLATSVLLIGSLTGCQFDTPPAVTVTGAIALTAGAIAFGVAALAM